MNIVQRETKLSGIKDRCETVENVRGTLELITCHDRITQKQFSDGKQKENFAFIFLDDHISRRMTGGNRKNF